MKGDFTRNTFNPDKHFLRVLMQQGRVQLDADWNEQASILLHYLQTLAADLIGPYAGPVGDYGFEINGLSKGNFKIGKGRYYVSGILCENERDINYLSQPDYPLSEDDSALAFGDYIVYLDVWERHISFVEDDDIREKALNGPDTATRSKVIWQVKVYKMDTTANISCQDGSTSLNQNVLVLSEICMSARAKQGKPSTEPCLTEPEAQYRGAENQLYRVEIHDGNIEDNGQLNDSLTPSFKFSRENGSVIFPIKNVMPDKMSATTTIELEQLGCDGKLGLSVADWVEYVDDGIDLLNIAKPLAEVQMIDPINRTITLSGTIDIADDYLKKHPFLRRWDQKKAKNKVNTDGVIKLTPDVWDVWISLEDGIEVKFSLNGVVRRGDYWLIPARYVTGDVEWPKIPDSQDILIPKALPPIGTVHYYAPLATITVDESRNVTSSDCRCSFESVSSGCQNITSGRLGIGMDLGCPQDTQADL